MRPVSSSLTGGLLVQQMGLLHTWYKVTSGGLEQGFSISKPSSSAGDRVALDLGSAAGWRIGEDGKSLVEKIAGRSEALVYGSLAASDARGRTESARFEIVGGQAEIAVHLSPDVTWPLRIDPT